jgi:hypothetical protein
MNITLELPPDLEAKLRERAAQRDAETVRRLLMEAIAPAITATVEAFLGRSSLDTIRRPDGLTDAEFEALADELADLPPILPGLTDEAITRDGIYACVHPLRA